MSKHKLLVAICAVGMTAAVVAGCSNEKNTSNGTITSGITLFGNKYTGSYTGELNNGNPEGKGVIEVDGDIVSKVEGTWKDGSLDGKCTITYSDGSIEEGDMVENRFDGEITKTFADGTYNVMNYNSGIPNGAIKYYDSKGTLTDYDWNYEQVPIKKLISQVKDVKYSQLIYYPDNYVGKMIKATGTVESVYEAKINAYITIKDSDGKIYVCKCKNMKVFNGRQSISQTYKVGDKVQVYGYLLKTDMYTHFNDDKSTKYNQYTGTLPYVEVVYSYDVNAGEFNPLNPSYTYEDVAKNPYGYAGMKAKVNGKVNYIELNNKKNTATIKLEVGNKQFYYVNFKYNKKTKVLPAINDEITIEGKYYGIYKEEYIKNVDDIGLVDDDDIEYRYEVYPYINAKNVIENK